MTGCASRMIEVTIRRQPRQRDRDQQVARRLRRDAQDGQPGQAARAPASGRGRRRRRRPRDRGERGEQRGHRDRAGRPARVAASRAGSPAGSRRSTARCRSRGRRRAPGPRRRRPPPIAPEIRTTPTSTTGSASRVARDGRSPRSSHATMPTTMTWRLPSTVASPRPDGLDRVVPEHQVAGEEEAGDRRQPDGRRRQAAVAPLLGERDEREQRQPEQRAEDRAGRRRHLRVAVEDAGERDARRAEQGRQPRPLARTSRARRAAGSAGRSLRRSAGSLRRHAPRHARFSGRPTKRRPSSSYWLGIRRGRRLEHEVAARLGLREGHHLADVGLVGEQRRPAVDAERDPAVRRGAVLERVEDRAELLAHPLERLALEQERALEQVAPMDPDRAAAELPAVEGEVVLERPGPAGRVVRRRVGPGRRTR